LEPAGNGGFLSLSANVESTLDSRVLRTTFGLLAKPFAAPARRQTAFFFDFAAFPVAKPPPILHIKPMDIAEIIDNFELLDEWDDRYRYLIELGRALAPLPEGARSDANKVRGCASQVWLTTDINPDGAGGPVLTFQGDSDAHIVRGLIAVLFALYSGKHANEILDTDAAAVFERLGLKEHLTPQRSNGFRSMVERIRRDATNALAAASA
jgi:cysteine desulfuration protein SufE